MNVVLDLDGTIVFADQAEIAIPGRSRCSYLSAGTAHLLEQIGNRSDLYLASARNSPSVAGLVRLLPNVRFAGFVLESGLVAKTCIDDAADVLDEQRELSSRIAEQYPDWEIVPGYEKMVCCVAMSEQHTLERIRQIAATRVSTRHWHSHRERHKTFIYPMSLCKESGLNKLGVTHIDFAAGDDPIYDASLLSRASVPCTLGNANQSVIDLVRRREGWVFDGASHKSAEKMLCKILKYLR